MDIIDTIFPFLIIAVYIVSIFWKKKNQNRETNTPGNKSSGAQQWLESLIGQISDEITPHEPKPTPAPHTVVWEKNDGVTTKPPPAAKVPVQKKRKHEEAAKKQVPQPSGKSKKHKTPISEQRQCSEPVYSRKMLQNRIIWAEILGPPVALRKEDNRKIR